MSDTETGGLLSLRVRVRYRLTTLFNQMGWKKILSKDFSEFLDVLVEIQPCAVDLVGSINKSANITQFVGIKYEVKIISQQAREGFLAVYTCDGKTGVTVD